MKKLLITLVVVFVLAVVAVGALAVAWWSGWLMETPPPPPSLTDVFKGPVRAPAASFELALYFLAPPPPDVTKKLDALLARDYAAFTKVDGAPDGRLGLQLNARLESNVASSYKPPTLEQLQYSGEGLTPVQSNALQQATHALVIRFGAPQSGVWEANRLASRLVAALARETHGLPWDEQTREVFSEEAWEERRVTAWTEERPEVSDHITIHFYQNGELVRAISLGMAKFGLPDLVVEDLAQSNQRTIGHIINLLAQAMAEGAEVGAGGEMTLRLASLVNAAARDPQVESLKEGATGEAVLVLRNARRDEGDPDNRLVEIGFDRAPGVDAQSRQSSLLSTFFGSEDAITHVDHSPEVLAASARAKAKLATLHRAFDAGFQPGEYLLVKAPFPVPGGGNEWMWVEVSAWTGKSIRGLLQNEPFEIPTLHSGQVVEVREDDIFDYILHHPDGTTEGNETAALLEAQGKAGSGEARE
jgi:uncharacterized protein YegJ (DUF2314 family)